MADKVLIIEGSNDLREGFHKLLQKKLNGQMPSFKMGGNAPESRKKFEQHPGNTFLLIDLDGHESTKNDQLKHISIEKKREGVFFMIQEMEAWFLSQPDVIKTHFDPKNKLSANLSNLKNQNPMLIVDPLKQLSELVKKQFNRSYHKVNDGVKLLANLNADELMHAFPEFNRLITTLQA